MANYDTYYYTPSVAEEVYEVGVYQRLSNLGNTVIISIRDVTDNKVLATSEHNETIVGTADTLTWNTATLGTPLQLTAGREYAVSIYADVGNWSGYSDNSAYQADKTLKLTGQSAVPTDFNLASTSADSIQAYYAETRASSTPPPAGEEIVKMTVDLNSVICESTDFAAGMTFELWPAGVEGSKEVATVVTAIDTLPTAAPQYWCTFTAVPSAAANDHIKVIYDATAGDIKSVTGGIALASSSYEAPETEVCGT